MWFLLHFSLLLFLSSTTIIRPKAVNTVILRVSISQFESARVLWKCCFVSFFFSLHTFKRFSHVDLDTQTQAGEEYVY